MMNTKRNRPYSGYRDSGVDWLKGLPSHWSVKPLKHLASRIGRGVSPSYCDTSRIAVINQSCVRVEKIDFSKIKFHDEAIPYSNKGLVLSGDVLINSTGTGTLGRVAKYEPIHIDRVDRFMADSHVTVISPMKENIVSKYLEFVLNTSQFQGFINSALISGSTNQIELSRQGLLNLPVPAPPVGEQEAIVSFLERETAHLDGLIERKNRLLELLEEQRRAVISQAVTRGLNPDAPLKDSGVPWLGQVPQHWEVRPLKFEAQMESGHTPSRTVEEYWVNCDIPWVSLFDTAHLKQHKVIYETKNMISQLGMNNSSARLLPAGSVVLSRDATVGRVGIMGTAMATSQHFVAWVCGKRLFNEYLYWTLTGPMQEHFQSLTNGATISTIGMPEIRQFAIPLPPLAEQKAISEHLDMQTGKLDVLRQKLEQSIAHLREYRAALITAAVTGQIDVREEATQS